MKKHLLITSDDFGMCHAINTAILDGMTKGLLTSTTLMAPCPWFPEAAEMTRKHSLKVGVHLTLTSEWDRMSWGPITRAPSLLNADGYFHSNLADLVKTMKDDEVLAEYDAQIARIKACGITPTHADIHMVTPEDDRPGVENIRELVRRTSKKHGLVYTRDYSPEKGLHYFTGQMSISSHPEKETWQTLENWTAPGFYHLIVHVAAATPEMDAICSENHPVRDWATPYRVADAAFVMSPATRERLDKLGFELIDAPGHIEMKGLRPR